METRASGDDMTSVLDFVCVTLAVASVTSEANNGFDCLSKRGFESNGNEVTAPCLSIYSHCVGVFQPFRSIRENIQWILLFHKPQQLLDQLVYEILCE